MKSIKFLALAILATSAVSANANVVTDTASDMKSGVGEVLKTASNPGAFSAEAGTLGYGANISWSADEYTEVQVGYTGGDLANEAEFEVEDVDFTVETDFSSPYVGIQVHPFKNWLSVGMGAMHMGNNSINATATPNATQEFEFNGETYTAEANDAKIDVAVDFKNTVSPYLTLGFRPNINNRFGLFAEVGAAYTGGIDVEVNASGNFTHEGQAINLEQTLRDIEDDARTEILDEVDGYDEWYPIVKAGATVRF